MKIIYENPYESMVILAILIAVSGFLGYRLYKRVVKSLKGFARALDNLGTYY